jgi:hypothetical protein
MKIPCRSSSICLSSFISKQTAYIHVRHHDHELNSRSNTVHDSKQNHGLHFRLLSSQTLTLKSLGVFLRSRDSAVAILMARVRFPVVQDISLLHSVQTDSWGPPSLISSEYRGGALPAVKRQGHEADRSPPSSAEVKKCEAILPVSHISSWHSA